MNMTIVWLASDQPVNKVEREKEGEREREREMSAFVQITN